MKSYIEALLFATPEPLTQSQINGIFPGKDVDLALVVDELNTEYENCEKLIHIKLIANGYQILTKPDCHLYLQRLYNKS